MLRRSRFGFLLPFALFVITANMMYARFFPALVVVALVLFFWCLCMLSQHWMTYAKTKQKDWQLHEPCYKYRCVCISLNIASIRLCLNELRIDGWRKPMQTTTRKNHLAARICALCNIYTIRWIYEALDWILTEYWKWIYENCHSAADAEYTKAKRAKNPHAHHVCTNRSIFDEWMMKFTFAHCAWHIFFSLAKKMFISENSTSTKNSFKIHFAKIQFNLMFQKASIWDRFCVFFSLSLFAFV